MSTDINDITEGTKPAPFKLSACAIPDGEAGKLTVEAEFKDGMLFTVRYTTPMAIQRISQTSHILQWNQAKKARENTLDMEKFVQGLVKHCIVGWRGITPRKLSKYILLRNVPVEQLDTEIPFDPTEACFLLQKLEGLETWLIEVARDASLYQNNVEQEAIAKNS